MLDTILKWWNRKWSNWEYCKELEIFADDYDKYPIKKYSLFVSKSNDGLVKYKRVKK